MIDRKTKFIGLIATIFFIVSLSIFLLALYTIVQSGQELQKQIVAIKTTNEKIKANSELASRIESTRDERLLLEKFVLTEDETGVLLTDIEKLATSQRVELTTSSLEVVKTKDEPDSLQVEFKIKGSEANIKNMLALLETLPYHSIVSSFSMSQEGTRQVESAVVIQLTLLES